MEEEAELFDVEGQVAAHRDLLEQLMQGIDDSQDTVDALREQISETEIDLNHLRNEIAELQRVKKMRDIGGTVFTDCPDFEVERLNPEHQDHLNAVLDRIYDLEHELEDREAESAVAQDECDALARDNQALEQELARTKIELANVERERKHCENSIESAQRRLKELKIVSETNKTNLKVTETAVVGLEGRQESLRGKTGGIVELEKTIASLQEEKSREEDALAELTTDIEKITEKRQEEVEEITRNGNGYTEMLMWDEENQTVQDEIKFVREQIVKVKAENEKEKEWYTRTSKRSRELTNLFHKWEGRKVPECNRRESVDELLAELAKTEKGTNAEVESTKAALEQLVIKNATMEEKIRKKQEEIERNMALFAAERVRLREQVDSLRFRSFEEEHQLITQIQALKLKLAQQKANKEGC